MYAAVGCENVASSAVRLTSSPVRNLRVTSSTIPVLADEQRQSLSNLTADFSLPGVTRLLQELDLYLFAYKTRSCSFSHARIWSWTHCLTNLSLNR